ncbi:MAG TPA: hypothetical protein VE861_06030, partial [Gemmatimonadaceae bacterium]|nr:hypothetical protein [Gemmatimonadaceae bacterium]
CRMAKPTVDGPGQAKLQALETATSIAQTVHGLVEKYALAVKTGQPTSSFGSQIKRAATPLVGLLRSQFQLLADLASDLILVSTRGGGADAAKLRMLRERVGQLKSGIELAVTSTTAKHAVAEPAKTAAPGNGSEE